jgi:hypothetical protein
MRKVIAKVVGTRREITTKKETHFLEIQLEIKDPLLLNWQGKNIVILA